MSRKIIHIDMDCFYAAVEIRDNPKIRNKPVAVGGTPEERGVLTTCNYIARKYGLHSAMATAHALRLCPNLILLPVNMEKYCAVSESILRIFQQYTSVIEPLSLDEAFLDVTECKLFQGSATRIAQAIKKQIYNEQHLTASAGAAPNKFLAKIASEWNKPNGMFVITPEQVDTFVKALPVTKLFGVGPVTAKKMEQLKLRTCEDLQKLSLQDLIVKFGHFGATLYDLCRGIDDRPVETERQRKSISVEETYPVDLTTLSQGIEQLPMLLERLKERLSECPELIIFKLFIKIKFFDFTRTTVECIFQKPNITRYESLFVTGYNRHTKPIRLIGLGVRLKHVEVKSLQQLTLKLTL